MKSLQRLQSVKQRRWRELSPSPASWRRELPLSPGVYAFYSRNNKVLYVGKSKSLRNRISSYFQSRSNLIPKIKIFVPQIVKIRITETKTEFEALLLEAKCIRELRPKYNSRLTDDRSPIYIVVTNEKFPRVMTARKTDLGGVEARSVYGPFLSGETVRKILKIARRLFPFCNQPRRHLERPKGVERSSEAIKIGRHRRPRFLGFVPTPGRDFARNDGKRPCFYRHLGLCPGVCSGEISERRYLAIIKKLELFLAGDFVDLKLKLDREMKGVSKRKDYERAAAARDAAAALESLSLAGEYEEESAVTSKEREKDLAKLLSKLGLSVRKNCLRIEGFDVSNSGGRLATAAMVVFVGGMKNSGEYRHFRIRTSSRAKRGDPDEIATARRGGPRNDGGGDPRMMAEAVERRLTHPEWGKPDLVMIDGGGPQLSMIQRELKSSVLLPGEIPYFGLAKSPDRLIIPTGAGFKTMEVSSRDLGFQLLQQVRDEAHRFSRRLHLKLRSRVLVG